MVASSVVFFTVFFTGVFVVEFLDRVTVVVALFERVELEEALVELPTFLVVAIVAFAALVAVVVEFESFVVVVDVTFVGLLVVAEEFEGFVVEPVTVEFPILVDVAAFDLAAALVVFTLLFIVVEAACTAFLMKR